MTLDGHEQRAGFPAPCPYPSGLFADFEVAYIAPAIGGLEPHLLFGFPVEGYLPQKFHLLDAPQMATVLLRLLSIRRSPSMTRRTDHSASSNTAAGTTSYVPSLKS